MSRRRNWPTRTGCRRRCLFDLKLDGGSQVGEGHQHLEVPDLPPDVGCRGRRFLPDGVWWFFLFWAPAYVHDVYGYSSDSTTGVLLIFTLYLISMLSIIGGYLPTWFVGRKGMNPYAGRMRAMLIYAFFPLIGLVAQP